MQVEQQNIHLCAFPHFNNYQHFTNLFQLALFSIYLFLLGYFKHIPDTMLFHLKILLCVSLTDKGHFPLYIHIMPSLCLLELTLVLFVLGLAQIRLQMSLTHCIVKFSSFYYSSLIPSLKILDLQEKLSYSYYELGFLLLCITVFN